MTVNQICIGYFHHSIILLRYDKAFNIKIYIKIYNKTFI